MRILGIIPARGGSKGVPRKNLSDICGKPLISISIDFGNKLVENGILSRCIVSTDDKEIMEVSKSFGADVPFLRPEEAASDTAKAIEYVVHALESLESPDNKYDAIMILQPTSPCRNIESITEAITRLNESEADSLTSCYREEYINDLVMYRECGEGRIKPINPDHNKGVRRQEHEINMVRNGCVYVVKTPYLRTTGQLVCDQPVLLEMSKINSIDIDTFDDLTILRALLCK